jgi:hypothetical protein
VIVDGNAGQDDADRDDASRDDASRDDASRDDVEKRWHDPGMYRHAVEYCAGVLIATVLVFAAIYEWADRRESCARAAHAFCDTTSRTTILLGPGFVLIVGTVGAFITTYRIWRRHRAWPIWQGAAWFLMVVTLAYLAIGAGSVMA